MPPKKKKLGGRKGGKRSLKRGAVIDGVAITDMTKEQLEGHVYRLQKEAEREREERNYFQVERDKIKAFWDVTKQQLEEKEAQLQLKQKELEDAELCHLSEIKVYKEKMKHVMLEYQQHLNSNRKENMVALKIAENEHYHEESMLWKEKNELKTNVNQLMLEHNDTIKNIKLKHGQELHTLRQEFERKMGSLKDKHDEQLEYIKQEQEQRKRREIQEIEERKNQHIGNLIKTHDKSFIDMKNYYNDITQNNLSLINTLKEQVKSMRKKEERMEKQAETLSQKNEKLDEELCKAQEELTKLRKQINNYEREKDHYTVAKDKMKCMNNEIKGLKWENDVLIQQFKKVEKERDSLYSKFKLAIQDVEEKIGFKTLLLEKKMAILKEELEKKDAELNQALSSPSSVESAAVTQKLEDALEAKHSALKNLQVELAKVNKTNTLLLRSYETKLKYHGTSSNSSKEDSLGIRGERAVKSARPLSQRQRSIEDCLINRKMT